MALSSLLMDSTKSVAKGSELPEASPSATSMTGNSRARIKQILSWFGGMSSRSSLPAMSKGKSSTKSGLCCLWGHQSSLGVWVRCCSLYAVESEFGPLRGPRRRDRETRVRAT